MPSYEFQAADGSTWEAESDRDLSPEELAGLSSGGLPGQKEPSYYERFSRGLDKVLTAPRAPLDALSEKVSGGYAANDPRRNQWGVVQSSEVGTDAIVPKDVGNDTPLVSGWGHLSALSLPTLPLTHGNMILGKAEKAALALGIPEKVVGIPRALERKGLGILLGASTDPTAALGVTAGVKGVTGQALTVGERGLAGAGAVAGGKGALEAGGRVVDDLQKGELVDAGLDLVDVGTGLGMGYLGGKAALKAPRAAGAPKGAERAAQYVEKNLEQIHEVGPDLATKVRGFDNDSAVLAGQWTARMLRAMDGLGVNKRRAATIFSERIAPVIEGKAPLDALSPAERAVASEVRGLLDEVGGVAKAEGLLAELEPNYFPRQPKDMTSHDFYAKAAEAAKRDGISLEDALAEARGDGVVIATRAGRKGALEQDRGAGKVALQEGEYRTDPGVLLDYLSESARRIAEVRHFGKNGELATELINRITDKPSFEYAKAALDRVRGVEGPKRGAEASAVARQVQGVASLGLAPITQTTSIAQTVATAGVRPTAQAVFKSLWGAKDIKVQGVRSAAKRVGSSWRRAKLDAMEAGALANSTGKDLADVFGLGAAENRGGLAADIARAQTASGKVGAVTSRAPHLKLTGMMDEAQRVIAANTAQFLVPKLLREAQGTGMIGARLARARQRQLDSLGIGRATEATPEVIALAAKRISDQSQFRTGTSQLPLWATTPLGRAAFQFQSFGYQHTRFLAGVMEEAGHGNVAPLAKWAAVGAAAGTLSNELKDLIKGHGYDKFTEDDWARNLADAVGKGRHVDPTKNPILAAARGLAAAGGMGALGSLWERAQDAGSHPLATVAGPSGADAEQLLKTAAEGVAGTYEGGKSVLQTLGGDEERAAASAKEAGKHFGQAGQNIARTALQQVPVFGGQLAQEALSEDKPARAGYVGKLRDAAEDAGVLSVADETARGAAGRERAAELQERQETTKDVKAQTEAQLAARPKASLEKRLEKARKSGSRAEFENLIVDALRDGDMERVYQIAGEAAKSRIRFTRRHVAQLQARLLPRPEEEEPEEVEP